jgi:hypothetical protein
MDNLFIWRANIVEESSSSEVGGSNYRIESVKDSSHYFFKRSYSSLESTYLCPWCKHKLMVDLYVALNRPIDDGESRTLGCFCVFCGWGSEYSSETNYASFANKKQMSLSMKNFDTSDYDSVFEEIKDVLIQKNISPFRFEALVGNFFSSLGYSVEFTQKSKDGGKDLILYVNGNKYAIVEVKRWKDKIGVELVRQLRGVQFEDNVKQAILVTSNQFTKGAIRSASKNVQNHQINLWDADALLHFIGAMKSKHSLVESARNRSLFEGSKGRVICSASELHKNLETAIIHHYAYCIHTNDYFKFDNGTRIIELDVLTNPFSVVEEIKSRVINFISKNNRYGCLMEKITAVFQNEDIIQRICSDDCDVNIILSDGINMNIRKDSVFLHMYLVFFYDRTDKNHFFKKLNE